MIDVNKITSTLAKLPDQHLQQYAQMHKNDPYIMALAMSESNRRKEMRVAGQGAQGMQEQPKVVDQMLAEMAPQQMPEDMGIGQLPAGEMNFAGGGIIAFADGGDVERYQSGGLFETDPQKLRALAEKRLRLEQLRQGRLPAGGPFSTVPATAATNASTLRGVNPAGLAGYGFGLYHGDLNEGEAAELERRRAMGPTVDAQSTPPSPQDMAQFDAASNLYMTERAAKQAAAAAPKVDAAPKADTTRRAGPPATPLATPRAATGPTDIDALQQKYFGQIDQEVDGLRNARAGLVAGIKDLAEQNLAATRADIEKRGDVYKGREERLAKQEKGLEGMGDRNMGLALLQAGAAMMSTPGGLGVALGKGVQVGSERYAAGLDKIEAAKSKFAEARDRLDDLRINRDDMNAKDIRAAEKEARESELKGKEFLYNGLVSDLGIKQKNVTAIFDAAANALETDKRIASAEGIAALQERGATTRSKASTDAALQSPERMAFMAALEKTKTKENPQGDPAAAYQSIISMKREPVSMEKLRGDWLDMTKRMQIQADYPNIKTFEDYVLVMNPSAGGGLGGGAGVGGDGFRVVGVR
jgi:hypothetical protein